MEILPIDTNEQTVDIFTKGIDNVVLFKNLRHKLLGWIYEYWEISVWEGVLLLWPAMISPILKLTIPNSKFQILNK